MTATRSDPLAALGISAASFGAAPFFDDREITEAAVAAFRRLQTKVGTIMLAHGRPDGGLICERRRPGAPTLFYRVTAGGRIESDLRYEWDVRGFAPVPLPAGLE